MLSVVVEGVEVDLPARYYRRVPMVGALE